MPRTARACLLTLAFVVALAAPASASIYVAPTGNDAKCAPGTVATACATPAKALSRVEDGQAVICAPGTSYPLTTVTRAFSRPTRLQDCRIAGLTTTRTAANLVVDHVSVQGNTNIAGSGITLSHTTHANPAGTCIRIRGARNAVVDSSSISGCKRGIDSPYTGASTPATASDDSFGVTITNSRITGMLEDGIAIGDWTNVLIADNTIEHLNDPCRATSTCPAGAGRPYHNDGIQFFGGVHDVQIRRNRIDDSGSQGMLLQTAGAFVPNTGIVVDGNTVTHIRGVAFQVDASGTVTVNANTLCGGEALTGNDRLQALWVWPKVAGARVSVTNNATSMPWKLRTGLPGASVIADRGNVTACGAA
jgi:hypothetical protein